MDSKAIVKKALQEKWYTQGCPGVPLFFTFCSWSTMILEPILGYGYTKLLMRFEKGQCEIFYLQTDLFRLWEIIRDKLKSDPEYLQKVRADYDLRFSSHRTFLEKIRQNLPALSDEQLVDSFKRCKEASVDSVGIAHVIEAIGQEIEKDFREVIEKEIGDQKLKENFLTLSQPSEVSFVAQEEKDLAEIGRLPAASQDQALNAHLQKYYWVQSGFSGAKEITKEELRERMKLIESDGEFPDVRGQKESLIKELGLSAQAQQLIHLVDFSTIWQDRRKANMLQAINWCDEIINEIVRRLGVEKEPMYHLILEDLERINVLADVKNIIIDAKKRMSGFYYYFDHGKRYVVDGNDYKELHASTIKTSERVNEIQGSIANGGSAIGKVKVCLDIASIDKVENGDILVASMTRPEYMPALRRCAAIVTDEGGITCHAAIVARELKIPAVIGTRIATKVLKDGDMVEVRANHGVVKIIK